MRDKGSTTILILIIAAICAIGGFLYLKTPAVELVQEKFTKKPANQTALQSSTPIKNIAASSPTPTISIRIDLPKIVERNSSSIPTSWKEYSDSRGYKFNYPSNWFISEYDGKAQQVQNWNPKSVKRPTPLGGDQSKWDVGFSSKDFNSIDEMLSSVSGGIRVDKIERSKTINDQTIYFIEGTGSFFGNEDVRIPVIYAIVVNDNKFFSWYGIAYGGNRNVEILKQVVESIRN